MTALRTAAQQALEAWQTATYGHPSHHKATLLAMTALRAALAQQAEPEAYGYASRLAVAIWEKHYKDIAPQWKPLDDLMGVLTQIDNMTSGLTLLAQQAKPVEPVARECSDPMCACRGGPCAECEEGEREKEIEDLRSSLYFYQRRCEALQSWQSKMRDPERTIVCDILANGKTLDPAFAGDRYTEPPKRAEPLNLSDRAVQRRLAAQWGYVPAAQAEPVEPVAWVLDGTSVVEFYREPYHNGPEWTPLCKCADTPPQRKPLTEEEIYRIHKDLCNTVGGSYKTMARAVEAAHGIKE